MFTRQWLYSNVHSLANCCRYLSQQRVVVATVHHAFSNHIFVRDLKTHYNFSTFCWSVHEAAIYIWNWDRVLLTEWCLFRTHPQYYNICKIWYHQTWLVKSIPGCLHVMDSFCDRSCQRGARYDSTVQDVYVAKHCENDVFMNKSRLL